MELKDILGKIHRTLEADKNKTIPQPIMAKEVGVSGRTYGDYLRGTLEPKAMKALLNLLTKLENEDIVKIIRLWEEEHHEKK